MKGSSVGGYCVEIIVVFVVYNLKKEAVKCEMLEGGSLTLHP